MRRLKSDGHGDFPFHCQLPINFRIVRIYSAAAAVRLFLRAIRMLVSANRTVRHGDCRARIGRWLAFAGLEPPDGVQAVKCRPRPFVRNNVRRCEIRRSADNPGPVPG